MKTTIPFLAKKLERFAPVIAGKPDTSPIASVKWFNANELLLDDILYVVKDVETLHTLTNISGIHILICAEKVTSVDPEAHVIILTSPCQPDEVFHEVEQILLHEIRLSYCAVRFLEILSDEGGLQNLVDEAYQILKNPIYIFDAGLKLTAASWDAPGDKHSERILSDKCLSEEDLNYINFERIHEKVRKSAVPVLVKNKYYGPERLVTMINKSGKDVGFIVVVAQEHPFEDITFEIVALLRDAVAQHLKKDSFVRNTKGFNYEYFIADMLDKKIPPGKQFRNRISYIDFVFLDAIYVLVVETGRSSGAVHINHICSKLETIISGSRTIIYNGQIVVIITRKHNKLLSEDEISSLGRFCIENGLFGGLSNSFKNIINLPEFYQQAMRAIELGVCKRNEPDLFVYKPYYMDHMVNTFIQRESAKTFCHPAMDYLMEYDQKNGTELAYTLYHYFLNERNLSDTSNEMHVHRNTLIYRIKKIKTFIDIDFDDCHTRQYIILSYATASAGARYDNNWSVTEARAR